MKERPREESRFLTFFACLLLNAGLTLGSIFCPITAFRLPVDEVQLAVLLVLVCLLLSVLYRFRWAGLFLLGLWILILAGAFLLAREELEQGAGSSTPGSLPFTTLPTALSSCPPGGPEPPGMSPCCWPSGAGLWPASTPG